MPACAEQESRNSATERLLLLTTRTADWFEQVLLQNSFVLPKFQNFSDCSNWLRACSRMAVACPVSRMHMLLTANCIV